MFLYTLSATGILRMKVVSLSFASCVLFTLVGTFIIPPPCQVTIAGILGLRADIYWGCKEGTHSMISKV